MTHTPTLEGSIHNMPKKHESAQKLCFPIYVVFIDNLAFLTALEGAPTCSYLQTFHGALMCSLV